MVNVRHTAESLAKLAMLKFFPADPEARAALVGMVCEMATTDDQVNWLVRRMLTLYNEWPGPRELRACFCSRHKPADGIEAKSEKFLEGIPSEKAPTPMLALPPGAESVSPQIDNAIKLLARSKDMNRPRRIAAPVISNPNFRPVTQADIDRAVNENRDKAARAELEAQCQ